MRAGLENLAERIEHDLEDCRRSRTRTVVPQFTDGEVAALERWAARIRASVTL